MLTSQHSQKKTNKKKTEKTTNLKNFSSGYLQMQVLVRATELLIMRAIGVLMSVSNHKELH